MNPMPTQAPSIVPNPVPPAPLSTVPSQRPITPSQRVIHPLPQQNPRVDMGQLMNQEINRHSDNPSLPPTPPVPPLM